MTMGLRRYGAFWIRGLWVYLMLIAINVVVGLLGAGVARLLRLAISDPMIWAFTITLLAVGLPFSGWLFEQLASRLPRLRQSSQATQATER
jgi:ABC-type glycerol-3-phosphate transport system permease component